jgi:hypothetical protein
MNWILSDPVGILTQILQDEAKSEKSSMDKSIQEGGGQGDDDCDCMLSLLLNSLF